MSRPKNPANVYSLRDAVTGEPVPTNPKQFRDLLARYDVTPEVLQSSYVGQAGRNKLASDKETVETAVEKYGLHINVANQLKALRPVPVRVRRSPKPVDEAVNVEVAPVTEVTSESGGVITEEA